MASKIENSVGYNVKLGLRDVILQATSSHSVKV